MNMCSSGSYMGISEVTGIHHVGTMNACTPFIAIHPIVVETFMSEVVDRCCEIRISNYIKLIL